MSDATGVWAVTRCDYDEYIDRVFPDEISALRYAVQNYGEVKFIEYGKGLRDE